MENKDGLNMGDSTLIEDIYVFIEYAVTPDELDIAREMVKRNRKNPLVLAVLFDFYKRLPELRDEAVKDVCEIVSRLECYLLEVKTNNYAYLYFYDGENTVYVGEKKDGIDDSDILSFFGYSNNDELKKNLEEGRGGNENNVDDISAGHSFCPACSVKEGALHELGCPVEVCPWCDSQFTYCNCRFEKLGIDEIESEDDIDRLEIILNEKGRIPYKSEQSPAYPVAGDGKDDR